MNNTPHVVFCTATQSIIDYVHVARGETNEQAIRRLAPDYGTALDVLPVDEAQRRYEARFKTDVSEIAEEEFHSALNVLPPVGWRTALGAEVFRISERTAGCITAIYVAMQGRYFTFQDDIRLDNEECCSVSLHSSRPILPPPSHRRQTDDSKHPLHVRCAR